MKKNHENPIAQLYREKYESLSQEGKIKWDNIRGSKKQLLVIKRKRKVEIDVGDIFVVSPRKNLYFYGKVIKTNIHTENENSFIEGKQTVLIFKCKNKDMGLNSFVPNYNDLLIQPSIVDKSYWTQGYFFTIGNIPLTQEDNNLDYGFYFPGFIGDEMGNFCTEEGEAIEGQPKNFGIYGITTITGIFTRIEQSLILEPSLLE